MVKYSAALDSTFGALADATRRALLARLAQGEARVTELAQPFRMSLPAISKHLRVLESAGLLEREIDGRIHRCRLAVAPMKRAAEWIAGYRVFWEAQFDALEKYLKKTTDKENRSWPRPTKPEDSHCKSGAPSRRRAKKSSPHGPSANN